MQEILSKVVTIASTVLGALAVRYLDLILKEYQPDVKKHISLMKKYLLFSISFIFPILNIVLNIVYYNKIDKYFVVIVVTNVAIILLALIFDLMKRHLKYSDFVVHNSIRRIESELDLFKSLNETIRIQEKHENIIKQHNEMLKLLSDKITNQQK